MQIPVLSKTFCCCSLKSASLWIGYIELAVCSLIYTVLESMELLVAENSMGYAIVSAGRSVNWELLIVQSCILIVGVSHKNPDLVKVDLLARCVETVSFIFTGIAWGIFWIIEENFVIFTLHLLGGIAIIALCVYVLWTIYSFYMELMDETVSQSAEMKSDPHQSGL